MDFFFAAEEGRSCGDSGVVIFVKQCSKSGGKERLRGRPQLKIAESRGKFSFFP